MGIAVSFTIGVKISPEKHDLLQSMFDHLEGIFNDHLFCIEHNDYGSEPADFLLTREFQHNYPPYVPLLKMDDILRLDDAILAIQAAQSQLDLPGELIFVVTDDFGGVGADVIAGGIYVLPPSTPELTADDLRRAGLLVENIRPFRWSGTQRWHFFFNFRNVAVWGPFIVAQGRYVDKNEQPMDVDTLDLEDEAFVEEMSIPPVIGVFWWVSEKMLASQFSEYANKMPAILETAVTSLGSDFNTKDAAFVLWHSVDTENFPESIDGSPPIHPRGPYQRS